MGWVWEAKILDFRIIFDVFSKQISNNVLESQKIEKNSLSVKVFGHFGLALRNARPPGERKREGIKSLGLHNELALSDSPSVIEFDI